MAVANRVTRAQPQASDPLADPAKSKLVEQAPDGRVPAQKDELKKISLNFEPDFLAEVDEKRKALGLTRPAIIKLALRNLFKNGITVGGE